MVNELCISVTIISFSLKKACARVIMWQLATRQNEMIVEVKKQAQSRLNVRLSSSVKMKIARAAHILDQDLTEFAISTLNDRAVEVLEQHEAFELSESQRQAFFDILDGVQPKSTKRAVDAAERYKSGVIKGSVYEFED